MIYFRDKEACLFLEKKHFRYNALAFQKKIKVKDTNKLLINIGNKISHDSIFFYRGFVRAIKINKNNALNLEGKTLDSVSLERNVKWIIKLIYY